MVLFRAHWATCQADIRAHFNPVRSSQKQKIYSKLVFPIRKIDATVISLWNRRSNNSPFPIEDSFSIKLTYADVIIAAFNSTDITANESAYCRDQGEGLMLGLTRNREDHYTLVETQEAY